MKNWVWALAFGASHAGADEARFSQLIDLAIAPFQQDANAFGATLSSNKIWGDSTANGTASHNGGTWSVVIFGGLYKMSGMTEDAFTLAVCHEIGHLIGGYPFYNGRDRDHWFTSEGQADYFAGQICLPRIWKADFSHNLAAYEAAPALVQDLCSAATPDDLAAAHICARTAVAAKVAMGTLLSTIVDFDKPDASEATTTFFSKYPSAQCRLDTYFRAARCPVHPTPWLLPGVRGNGEMNSLAAENLALEVSCHGGYRSDAARPSCWFREH